MQSDFRLLQFILLVAIVGLLSPPAVQAGPSEQETLDAMKKASSFMMNTVSYRGGFVEKYTEDLSERWGEVPARPSIIWVQETGTVSVGKAMLDAYQRTGDAAFLGYAERVANALIWGQLPCGGWHYFIDFDPQGTQQWYHDVLEKAWGWEEFYHWSGNATFDDNTSIGAASFLLDVYETTQKPEYRIPVEKAIQFVLDAQYPLGGWPQRFPLSYDAPFEGRPDYSSFYTFNDGVISGCIHFLLRAHALFGDERYHDAAKRGMFFTALAQMPRPQAGWAQQYDMDLSPAQARSYEPASVNPSQTVENIHALMKYYKTTGDRRFLQGIPDALVWLKNSPLPEGHSSDGHTHAQFLEVGTNKPLYAHRSGTGVEDGRYWVDYQPGNFPDHYG
ncbi:MAG: pectate lyase, partial [Candidatus Hydrogenedentes bacterium]|nr:pectate lyase [Candidatus Hydrogenedentota bacterium]